MKWTVIITEKAVALAVGAVIGLVAVNIYVFLSHEIERHRNKRRERDNRKR